MRLGERGRRDRFGARRGESLFSLKLEREELTRPLLSIGYGFCTGTNGCGSEPNGPAPRFSGPFQPPGTYHLRQRLLSAPFQNTWITPSLVLTGWGSEPNGPPRFSGPFQAPDTYHLCQRLLSTPFQNTAITKLVGLTGWGSEPSGPAPRFSGPCQPLPSGRNHLCQRLLSSALPKYVDHSATCTHRMGIGA